ncbi:sensor histidine kinase [Nocardia sp. BMG111209]|uniref:sensor histidine kinase n=1 Tax=Nocardia sp. BMG111209 TaxID=1160137 RepID=UPI00039F60E1|nr:sensor histidine kinase [Nocardia sp. BMG111209]
MRTPTSGLPRRLSRALDRAAARSANAGGPAARRPGFGGMLAGGMAIVWLLYLIGPIQQAWVHGHVLRAILACACVIGYGTLIATTLSAYRGPDWEDGFDPPAPGRGAWIRLAAMAVLFAAESVLLGAAAVPSVLYLAVVAIFVLPLRQSGIVAGLVAVLVIVFALIPGWRFGGASVVLALIPPVIWLGREIGTRGRRLRELTRRQQAELAIVAERNRVARDVHDILGHSLTVITVKSELAQRLLDIDPERARTELADVERLAREALAGVRETVGGLREVSLAGELANARTALHAAGITADLPDIDVPGDRGIVLGWVLREAVTNVVRHSRARHCRVRATPSYIEIVDDGKGLDPDASFGSGLRGLRERVRAAGGTFALTTPPDGGLHLAVGFDERDTGGDSRPSGTGEWGSRARGVRSADERTDAG